MKRTYKTLLALGILTVGLFAGASVTQAAIVTVQSGDTLSLLFPTTWQQVGAKYGIDPNWIYPGQVYSDDGLGSSPSDVAGVTVSRSTQVTPQPQSITYRASGGPNGYGVGWCTWWVKEKRPDIGGYWGNAGYNWLSAAQSAGFATGYTPRAGAIGVMTGHVVYIESVNGNMVNISEMGYNYTPGIVTYRTVPASSFAYIY